MIVTSEADKWHIGDRYYGLTVASSPDSLDLELEDLGPGTGRGFVAIASKPDGSDNIAVQVFADQSLPIELLEGFITEARLRL